jgi:hypothetical protein
VVEVRILVQEQVVLQVEVAALWQFEVVVLVQVQVQVVVLVVVLVLWQFEVVVLGL